MKFEKEILEKANKLLEIQDEYRYLMNQWYKLTGQEQRKYTTIPHEIKQASLVGHAIEKLSETYDERLTFWKEEVEKELKRQKNNSCANMSQ